MSHRAFSRNARSSRAVPVKKMIAEVRDNPVIPPFPANCKGMSPKNDAAVFGALGAWKSACSQAIQHAELMAELGVHKQVVNRILEPYSHIDVLITSTQWNNFYKLRLAHDAQDMIQILAARMSHAREASTPTESDVHLPYVQRPSTWSEDLAMISAARCARISYKPFDLDHADTDRDRTLANILWRDGHLSPFEHQARGQGLASRSGNFHGWDQFRKDLENAS